MKTKLLALFVILSAVTLSALWASPRSSEATVWNPRFAAPDFYTLLPSSPGANSQIRAQFNVDAPSANFTGLFGGAITFGSAKVLQSADADIPGHGASVGHQGFSRDA